MAYPSGADFHMDIDTNVALFQFIPRSMIPATGFRRKDAAKVTRSCRKTPEIAGTWKQYSDRILSGFFPLDCCQIPVPSDRNRSKSFRQKSQDLI
jgi:hypothetical protein